MFSQRSTWELQPNLLSQALQARRQAGLPVLDLTLSNPTQAGFRTRPSSRTSSPEPTLRPTPPNPWAC